MKTGIIWHQTDLRTEWNLALSQAVEENDQVLPVYIYSPKLEKLGGASQFWLSYALEDLAKEYKKLGAPLVVKEGNPLTILTEIIQATNATSIYWNVRFEPAFFRLQEKIKNALEKLGISVHTFNGSHLLHPNDIQSKQGKPYSTFIHFYNTALKTLKLPSKPSLPHKILGCEKVKSTPLLFSHEKWKDKLHKYWIISREAGLKHLHHFVKSHLKNYDTARDFPATPSTSNLSPYLHFGQLSSHEVWLACKDGASYQRQLLWREFSTYFLFHFPQAQTENWNHKFDRFPWAKQPALFKKWTSGKTGYPIVDAGMRQLWETGWMHNRVRMIVASFLTKDLLLHWKEGEKWFWDTLVDADSGNNTLGWQWVAGTGPDAAPYFRIFNPILQGEKFDPDGEYIRKYIPELKNIPNQWIHHPWDAPKEILQKAHITLGKTYPKPIVDHKKARAKALSAFHKIS